MMEFHHLSKLGSIQIENWDKVIQSLPGLSFRVRKQLITMCRSRYYPDVGTRLYTICGDLLRTIGRSSIFVRFLVELFQYPVLTGFFLSVVLSCPYSRSEVNDIKDSMIWKELSTMEKMPRGSEVAWYTLACCVHSPLHSNYSLHPAIPRQIKSILDIWKQRCSVTLLYPHSGHKSISRSTKRRYYESINQDDDLDGFVTTTNLEQYYSDSGIQILGGCEMRQKWYPTNSSPRTYYAMGGDAYFRSRFLRNAVNWLCDYFPSCHRKRRVRPDWIRVDDSDEIFIYDLSSFTSNMHEQRHFLDFLASYCDGTEVKIMDSYRGVLITDLGHLLREYNELNCEPTYSMERVWNVDLELSHSVAGFLGVYANLATCTFPHAIALSTITDSSLRSWCAGDDAGTGSSQGERIVHETASTIGDLAIEKVYVLSEPGSQALKRPVTRYPGGILVHNSVLWPAWCMLFERDPRFALEPLKQKRARFASAVTPFLQSVIHTPLEPIEKEFIVEVLSEVYTRLHLPLEGWLPVVQGMSRPYSVPIIGEFTLTLDPLAYLAESYYPGHYIGPETEGDSFVEDMLEEEDGFECFPCPRLSHLEKLGYISSEKVKRLYDGESGRLVLHDHLQGQITRQLNRYSFVEEIPDHLRSIIA